MSNASKSDDNGFDENKGMVKVPEEKYEDIYKAKVNTEVNGEICDQKYYASGTALVIFNDTGLMLGVLKDLNEREESGDKFFYCRTKRNAEEIKAYFSELQPHNLSDPCFPLFIARISKLLAFVKRKLLQNNPPSLTVQIKNVKLFRELTGVNGSI